ncbi:tRNA 2-thiouridine(34) synthase MnmA [Buchananella hordeovulneris]|uniref:tRNA 2-thiouridine(34) synthase MnmA n=1 Tax=Buchananella hordeovulneris TaxID=52770 RepID=UPI0026DD327C|nr:tRNA 2-thiouridine(34) synthase MnmA [Buchananella hordeovulneris]MDO5080428.1 tRNA 2-thiouridine(34) synthase MnmA [Buchananella hordeovulneris]
MRVLAALSGGVDSAVAAARAVDAGHDVVGVHMALSRSRAATRAGARGCCTIEDADDARYAAHVLGIPYYVWDLADSFEETVVSDFLAEYEAGRTPNPCVRCNEFVKFSALLERAVALGFDAVCTGHYARVVPGAAGPELHRAANLAKDQSYVLAVVGQARLGQMVLPLGDVDTKDAVRAEAEARGLSVSNKPDSYDICFVADGNTRGFLRERLGVRPGNIIDQDGNVLAQHEGTYGFTVGQRKGLGVDAPAPDGAPRYVLETRPQTGEVVVGPLALLTVDELSADQVVWLAPDVILPTPGQPGLPVGAQFRAHGAALPGRAWATADGGVVVQLAGTTRAVAAGQSLVLYADTRVLGQGTITGARRRG